MRNSISFSISLPRLHSGTKNVQLKSQFYEFVTSLFLNKLELEPHHVSEYDISLYYYLILVHEAYGKGKLVRNVSDLLEGIGDVAVTLEEVKDTLPEHLERQTHVAVVVEAVKHPDAQRTTLRVFSVELLQDIDLQLCSFPVFVDVLDDLQSHVSVVFSVTDLCNLAESTLTEGGDDLVAVGKDVPRQVSQVSVKVVCHRTLSHQVGAGVGGEGAAAAGIQD